jgi:NAD(P)-dependent dehydrogenase (short-subunit alcohol dehydrogenase family)
VRSFARNWILDLKERKSQYTISPGTIETPGLDRLAHSEGVGEQLNASLVARCRWVRVGTPDEVARAQFSGRQQLRLVLLTDAAL